MSEKKRIEALVWSAVLRAYNNGLKNAFNDKTDTVIWVAHKTEGSEPCDLCKALNGVELYIEKAEDLFPVHPYCQCFMIPKLSTKKGFTTEEAITIAESLGIDWSTSPFNLEEFRKGLEIELEHGLVSSDTNITNDDPILTAKITLAHLNEIPDYNTRLLKMEEETD